MNITFLKDHQSPHSGNEFYRAGTEATLERGGQLVQMGVARAGWTSQDRIETAVLTSLSDMKMSDLVTLARAREISYKGLKKADLIAALSESDDN